MAVLEAFRATGMGEGCTLLSPADLTAQHGAVLADGPFAGGLWSPHERRVESRDAIPRLAAWLEGAMGVTFHRRTLVKSVTPGRVETTAGTLTVSGTVNTTFLGNITNGAGTTGLIKNGSSTLILGNITANNTYAGQNSFSHTGWPNNF
jgi:autotransporter-associated beta strand protein